MASEQINTDKSETAQATRILTIIVYVVWNYFLHLSYWNMKDSWLHHYVKHGNYIKLYGIHILHIFTVLMYLYAAYKPPGYIQTNKHSNEFNSPKYCPVCKIIRPRRSKHCYDCGKCIIKYDHHCIFTANCVGADNHCLFLFYLIIQLLFLSWSFPLSINSIYYGFKNVNTIGYIALFYRFVCCLGISFASICVCLLFLLHVYLISTNQTTYMYLKKYGLCQKKSNNKKYDSKHFDPDVNTQNKSILSNIILFVTNPIPNDWRIGKLHDDITPHSEWLTNEEVVKQNYSDMTGVGCVPLPSFKQD